MSSSMLFRKLGEPQSYALLRRHDDLGYEEVDLLRPPARFWADGETAPSGAEMHVDVRRVSELPTPAELIATLPEDSWAALTRRSLARLFAWFLVVEDPQRRLEAQRIVTLAHQASVVQHISEQPHLHRVLLADEVGLGKTIEAGLLIRRLLTQHRGARVLYLAPARLVRNVRSELEKLGLPFRSWVATSDRDATLSDPLVVASIHRASHEGRFDEVLRSKSWDMIVADECHHLSDWAAGGGSPTAQYKLVDALVQRLPEDGRLLLMSGTPHQGHSDRFKNLVSLLRRKGETEDVLAGRVIYRTKDDVRDWDGQPVFPGRQVNAPLVLDLGSEHRSWLEEIHEFFEPTSPNAVGKSSQRRAAGWRAGQALQWATSSVHAGLGYLIRQAIRARCKLVSLAGLSAAVAAVRPYRLGPAAEDVEALFKRMSDEVERQLVDADVEDIEENDDPGKWRPNLDTLTRLLNQGVSILERTGDAKWKFVYDSVLRGAGTEKVVLFAQPIETVTAVAAYLERMTGRRPALILGGQSDSERTAQVASFWEPGGPQYLISSRAGGEGLNMQVARRLVHLDVPWNPMELEQRVGRVHRFMSRRTIIVDTVVVKDSREVDTYGCARQKLKTIVSTLVPDDRFEALFGRVMALVPPEELQGLLGQGPVGPLNDDEREKIGDLVTRGFQHWKEFHDRYSKERQKIQALDPGQASWADLALFARQHLGATKAEGFGALRFAWKDGEVVSADQAAEVLAIGGACFACGDYGGMPVVSEQGAKASQLGTNSAIIAKALRDAGFPMAAVGAAHLRWPDDARRAGGPIGVLVLARQSVRWEQGSYSEHASSLHCLTVTEDGSTLPLERDEKGAFIRSLLRSTVRREPEDAPALVDALRRAELRLVGELRVPTKADREARIVHAVTPLIAAIVA